jgi:hypothetical protein
MADGVLRGMDQQQKKEDEMIARYEKMKEQKLRKEEELKKKRVQREKVTMINTLNA